MYLNILTKREKFALVFLTLLLAFFILAQPILAGDKYGLDTTAKTGYGGQIPMSGETNASVIIGKVVGAALAFIGVVFFVLIVWGGFTWMMARGNEQEVVKAKELIYGSIIGLAIILAAYAITAYIGSVITP